MNELDNTQDTLRASSPIFLAAGIAVATGALLSQFAFSRGVRQQILERDGYRCVRCGSTDHLEASHLGHRKDATYNTIERGITLDTVCHYVQHVREHGKNDLTKRQNSWSIERLWERMDDEQRKRAIEQLYG